MDIRKIKKLIEMLEESNLGEIEIKEGEESIRISRAGTAAPAAQWMQAPAPAPATVRGRPSGRACGTEPAGRAHGHLAHGRHFLPLAVAERRVVRGGRQP